jgi:hypothetical protein
VDTTGPTSTAAISGIADNFRTSQSTVATGGTTDDRTPTFTGTLSAALLTGETLRIFNGTTLLGSATVTGTTWSFTTTTLPATAGTTYSITARVADAIGNLGTASTAQTFILNTSPTITATITNVADNYRISQSTVTAGGSTDDRTPTITGTISAEMVTGETLRIYNNGTTYLGNASVDNTALTWSFTPTLPATAGTNYSITARIADEGGNLGTASTARTFTLNNTPTTTAAITSIADDFGTSQPSIGSGATTDDRTPTISGTLTAALEDGETLRIYNGTALLGNATVDNTARTWSFMPTLPATSGSDYTIKARVASKDGILSAESAARTFRLDTSISRSSSSTSTITNLWRTDGDITLLSKFIGFANKGFSIYDSMNGLPSVWSKNIAFQSPTVEGFGIGTSINGSLRAGVDVQLIAQSGTATLNLNDSIKWFWTKSQNNIILNSYYDNGSPSLAVRGPSLDFVMTGRADITLDADFKYKYPGSDWTTRDLFNVSNDQRLFQETLSLANPQAALTLFDGAVGITAYTLDLGTQSTTQVTNGVTSSAESDLLGINLDIDKALSLFFASPVPFDLDYSLSPNGYDGLKVGAELNILDVGIEEVAKLRQDITTTVDSITGSLIMENGTSIPYTVGNPITLALTTYDTNNDGQLGFGFNYSKTGTVSNKTDFVLDTVAKMAMLGGKVYAKVDLPWPLSDFGIEYGLGPLIEVEQSLVAFAFNVYKDSWQADLGTGSMTNIVVG